jgi:hypothetical protein
MPFKQKRYQYEVLLVNILPFLGSKTVVVRSDPLNLLLRTFRR